MTVETLTSVRELDSRLSGVIQVRLLWCQADGRLWVAVADTSTGDDFRLEVRNGERPVDVFRHPYAYAAHHRIDTRMRSTAAGRLVSISTAP